MTVLKFQVNRRFCCGTAEIGEFYSPSQYVSGYDWMAEANTEYDAGVILLDKVARVYPGKVLSIWFHRLYIPDAHGRRSGNHQEDFQFAGLRQAFLERQGIQRISEYLNNSSGNIVEGWLWHNNVVDLGEAKNAI